MTLHRGMPLSPRPCSICRKWFRPHVRVGARQRVCSGASCQAARQKATQAAWRAAHPDYDIARRLQQRGAASSTSESAATPERAVEPMRVPRPLDRLPWDLAHEEFGARGADFLAAFGRVLLGPAQIQMRAQVPGIAANADGLPLGLAQTQMRAQVSGITGNAGGHAPEAPQT